MFEIKKALPSELLVELVGCSINGLKNKDCYYDQFHYVNRHFINKNLAFITNLVADALQPIHPGITANGLSFVNDFVAPVNLENASIHSDRADNKYKYHIDGIDRTIGPCYNLWIPLYRKEATKNLDGKSLFDVIERKNNPALYLGNGDPISDGFGFPEENSAEHLAIAQNYLGVSEQDLNRSVMLLCHTGKLEVFPQSELIRSGVIKPEMGDAYLFSASQYHASGPSNFERIGISMKFIVNTSEYGFRQIKSEPVPPLLNWLNLFLGCYHQFGDFVTYKKYLDLCISLEQEKLHTNWDRIDCVVSVLEDIKNEIT